MVEVQLLTGVSQPSKAIWKAFSGAFQRMVQCWAEPFGRLPPVRTVRTYPGQKSVTWQYWAATMRGPLLVESHLERHHSRLLDLDQQVRGLAAQPFRLFWPTRRGRRGHVPDVFARRSHGKGLVFDVCPDDRIEPDDAEAFAATARACELAGWRFTRVGAVDAVLLANVRRLAGYRHPRYDRPELRQTLLEVFTVPQELFAGAGRVGDRLAVLPVLYHLLWRTPPYRPAQGAVGA
ncbi:TnsA-like heteromeric transposase endonuclease subunit [Streptomyces sp. NPDC005474]|uniref:TnsA-like heteromeric transposase endonuclease subunit n=1 Tax=Streptomyces sp. NPDC005474 TaxID=3154878 RepID=UPI0034545315